MQWVSETAQNTVLENTTFIREKIGPLLKDMRFFCFVFKSPKVAYLRTVLKSSPVQECQGLAFLASAPVTFRDV